jgi:nucleoside-diphosphate-sugar epimerase
LFTGSTDQYVYISTCSVFARPVPRLPITESSPRRQPVFGYARDKLACELLLEDAYRGTDFPLTIVRPFHTYDRTVIPVLAGWTAIERMRAGRPVVVHGDGTSLWTLMHAADFARAFVPLLGLDRAVGESVNVVGGEILSWDRIHLTLAAAAGVRAPLLRHRSSESIAVHVPGWREVLEHDFRHSMLFDTSKLRSLVPGFAPAVPFADGAREILAHHDAEPAARKADLELDRAFDALLASG